MAETTQFMFDLRDVLEDLIKRQGIHKGRWKLSCELGFVGTNAAVPDSDGSPTVKPAAMVIIQRIGLSKTDEVNNLTMDAAEVNPATAKITVRSRSGGRRATKPAK